MKTDRKWMSKSDGVYAKNQNESRIQQTVSMSGKAVRQRAEIARTLVATMVATLF